MINFSENMKMSFGVVSECHTFSENIPWEAPHVREQRAKGGESQTTKPKKTLPKGMQDG